jgi:hypothetical protein
MRNCCGPGRPVASEPGPCYRGTGSGHSGGPILLSCVVCLPRDAYQITEWEWDMEGERKKCQVCIVTLVGVLLTVAAAAFPREVSNNRAFSPSVGTGDIAIREQRRATS